MLKFEDLKLGETYINIKHDTPYILHDVAPSSEPPHDVFAYYKDKDGFPWYRPLGLFMVKFRRITGLEKVINKCDRL
jgi:hypothetical protein